MSLIEVLVATMLISLLILGLATAFVALMRINRGNAEQQRVDHAVDNVAEQLKAVGYVSTGSQQDRIDSYLAELGLPGSDPSEPAVTITRVECRIVSATPVGDAYNSCDTDAGTQRITVEGTFRDRQRVAQIVVRDR